MYNRNDAVMCAQLGGARRSALGATKVTANFEDLEREAVKAEKLKMEAQADSAATLESVEAEVASLRLAYHERDPRDPRGQRASHDRLGIAAANRASSRWVPCLGAPSPRPNPPLTVCVCVCSGGGVSHSAAGDMTAIEQEGAPQPASADDVDDFNSVFTMIR